MALVFHPGERSYVSDRFQRRRAASRRRGGPTPLVTWCFDKFAGLRQWKLVTKALLVAHDLTEDLIVDLILDLPWQPHEKGK